MQFEMVRLSLVARPDLFTREKSDGSQFSREEWLRDIFGREIDFLHRGELFHFSPEVNDGVGVILAGRIGREVTVSENESPAGHLAPKKRGTWKAAIVLIDPTHHDDGQKAAIELVPAIGRPVAIFESLAAQINARTEPYILETNAIVSSDTFWRFVDSNQGEITSVEFEFVAPNMFGEADDYDSEMRDMQKNEKVQKAKLIIESKDGLVLNTPRVRRAADYANKGAGSIQARTKKKRRYNSKDKAQRVSIPNKDVKDVPIISLIPRLFRRILTQ
jgi:hypothetical protein